MAKLIMEVNSQDKAEQIINKGFRSHKMHWQKYHSEINNRTTYLIWYEPQK